MPQKIERTPHSQYRREHEPRSEGEPLPLTIGLQPGHRNVRKLRYDALHHHPPPITHVRPRARRRAGMPQFPARATQRPVRSTNRQSRNKHWPSILAPPAGFPLVVTRMRQRLKSCYATHSHRECTSPLAGCGLRRGLAKRSGGARRSRAGNLPGKRISGQLEDAPGCSSGSPSP